MAIWREVRVIMGRLGRDDRIMGRIGGRGWVNRVAWRYGRVIMGRLGRDDGIMGRIGRIRKRMGL